MEYIEFDLQERLFAVPEQTNTLDIRVGPIRIKDKTVSFNGKVIGEVSDLKIDSDPLKISYLALIPNGAIEFVRLATELSMYGVALYWEISKEFWQHSYKKNNVWVADVVELGGKEIKVIVL